MARSSWPVHFRNENPPSGNWYCARSSQCPFLMGFYFLARFRAARMKFGIVIQNARHGAICAALLASVLIVAASARDDASAGTSSSSASTTKSRKHSGTASRTHSASSKRRKKSSRVRGQEKIDSERAQAIQEALIREHYLNGEATGTWNQASEEAMRRYQADHGWQSKTVPDSRALIKLGLGPSKDHLL